MNKRISIIFLFSVLLPVLCLALIFSYKADLVLYLSVTVSSFLMSVLCLAGVVRIRKRWSADVKKTNSKLFLQTVLTGGLLPVLLIFLYYLFSGFDPSTTAILDWTEKVRESAMAAFMFGMPLWIFSFPWAFGVNYLYMDAVQKEEAEKGHRNPESRIQ
jgi:hypothetical protein